MVRLTAKYKQACKVLGLPVSAEKNPPHEALYGLLALRGYTWQNGSWKRSASKTGHAQIRLQADANVVEIMAESLAAWLELSDCSVHKISGPYKNGDNQQSRIYINFTYEKE